MPLTAGTRVLGLAISLSLVACQTPQARGTFVLASLADGGNVQAGTPTSSGQQKGIAPVGVHATGKLTISLASVFQPDGRQLLATLDDVMQVTVQVTDASGRVQTQIAQKGTVNLTFSGLATGQAKIEITVVDAAYHVIGYDVEVVTVSGGQTTTISPSVPLVPTGNTPVQPTPTPAPAAGGGSGGASQPQTGNLAVNLNLETGRPAHTLTLAASLPTACNIAAFDSHDNLWVLDLDGPLYTYTDGGTLNAMHPASALGVGGPVSPLAFDATGNTWLNGTRLDTTGQVAARYVKSPDESFLEFLKSATDSKGNLWATVEVNTGTPQQYYSVYKIGPDGRRLLDLRLGHTNYGIAVDSKDRVYVQCDTTILQLAADGTVTHTFTSDQLLDVGYTSTPADNMAVDSHDVVWFLNTDGKHMVKLAADGSELGSIRLPGGALDLHIDANDHIWVNDYQATGLEEFANDGTSIALFCLPDSTLDFRPLAVDSHGAVWISGGGGMQRYVP